MIIYGLRNCDTCRKAMKSLDESSIHDVRDDGFPPGLLERALAEFGGDLVNTRSTTWRSLTESERAHPPLDLLKAHPALMKRPLVESGRELYLGWTPETRKALGVA